VPVSIEFSSALSPESFKPKEFFSETRNNKDQE